MIDAVATIVELKMCEEYLVKSVFLSVKSQFSAE
jgi:hypothetical protein